MNIIEIASEPAIDADWGANGAAIQKSDALGCCWSPVITNARAYEGRDARTERSAGGFRDKVIDTLWSGRYPIDPRLTFQAAGKKCLATLQQAG